MAEDQAEVLAVVVAAAGEEGVEARGEEGVVEREVVEREEVDLEVGEAGRCLIARDWRRRRRSEWAFCCGLVLRWLLMLCSDEESGSEDSASASEEEEEQLSEDISSDEDDVVEAPTVKPYAALLQSLAADSAPAAKRRKLDTSSAQAVVHDSEDDEEEIVNVDEVEEEEEGPETAVEGALDDDQDEEDASDPFEAHFANPDDNILSRRLNNLKKNAWSQKKVSVQKIGKAVIGVPEKDEQEQATLPAAISSPAGLKLKQKLVGPVTKQRPSFDALEQTMAASIFNYRDVLFCERTPANSESLRRLACLHAVNHVFKYVFSLSHVRLKC